MSEDNLYEEEAIVLFRPSYSATWLNCEAALLDGRFYPDSAGEDAARGTVFHDLMAEWLNTGEEPAYRLHQIAEVWPQNANTKTDKPFLIEVDEDMFFYGEQCFAYIRDFLGRRYVEQRVDISHITPIPNQSGTLDVGFVASGRADIIDWKYGTGIKVFAKDNTQLLLYMAGVFEEHDWLYHFETMGLHIAQPRLKHWDLWEITRQELLDWMEWAKVRAKKAWKRNNRSYTVGVKQCTWCKRRDDCRAKLAALEAIADESFEETTVSAKEAKAVTIFTPPKSMETTVLRLSTQELARIYAFRRIFETWFRRIGEVLLERGSDGEDIGEFYITEGRKFRHWKEPKKLAEKLSLLGIPEDEIFERELLSPNKMTKVLREYGFRGKVLEQYIELFVDRLPGKPTLVRKGEDDREALPDYTGDFE